MDQELNKKISVKINDNRYTLLPICIIMDIIGLSTFTFPFLGEIFDVVWAPISAIVFFAIFKRKFGLIGGAFSFLEEILPGTDVIPTFTIGWVMKYIMKIPNK
jgi:hypothetical protein